MSLGDWLWMAAVAGAGAVTAVEGLWRLPFARVFEVAARRALEALAVLTEPDETDEDKEKELRLLTPKLLLANLAFAALTLCWLALVLAALWAASWLKWGASSEAWAFGVDPLVQGALLGIALLYGGMRRWYRRSRNVGEDMLSSDSFSPTERLVHRVAFRAHGAQKLAARWDQRRCSSRTRPVKAPVYVMGLARGGTTIVLRVLARTDQFFYQSYRSMPWVLAPYSWPLRRPGGGGTAPRPRAHGDGIMVDRDSPEAFEEVFWLAEWGRHYVQTDRLLPHGQLPSDVIARYREFVARIGAGVAKRRQDASDVPERYLCKTNNGVLRMTTLARAFPDASFIIVFRHPLLQAQSLWRQHQRFSELHRRDRFALDYMSWLGHFEFGSGLRPQVVDGSSPGSWGKPSQLEFWLGYWSRIYGFLLENAPERSLFVDHDRLCFEPARQLEQLAQWLDLSPRALTAAGDEIKQSRASPPGVPLEARSVYDQLVQRATRSSASAQRGRHP